MICQRCQKAQATVHIDEVTAFFGAGHGDNVIEEHHLCETCAQDAELPHMEAPKLMGELWQFLKIGPQSTLQGAPQGSPKAQLACGTCGLGLDELRRKGRVGCEDCYTTFDDYLEQLLERMHGATDHVGRIPGVDPRELERQRAVAEARDGLEAAIAAEDFERAAELRDRLIELEGRAELREKSGPREPDGANT